MEALILAGGMGTRLREVLPDKPKPMAPVLGRPFLEYLLLQLAEAGFDRIVLSLGYKFEEIVAYFGKEFHGIEIVTAIEEKPLGTGGAIKLAMQYCIEDHVYVLNGDTFLDLNFLAVEEKWKRARLPVLVAREVADTERFGRIMVSEDRVIGFLEKGVTGPGLINAGCYVLPMGILDKFPLGKSFSFETDFLEKEIGRRTILCYASTGYFIDIGVPADYQRAQTEMPTKFPLDK